MYFNHPLLSKRGTLLLILLDPESEKRKASLANIVFSYGMRIRLWFSQFVFAHNMLHVRYSIYGKVPVLGSQDNG